MKLWLISVRSNRLQKSIKASTVHLGFAVDWSEEVNPLLSFLSWHRKVIIFAVKYIENFPVDLLGGTNGLYR